MIERGHRLSVVCQCALLGLPRSTFYYPPMATSADALEIMRRLDALHLA